MERVAELRAEVEHWKGAAKEHAEAQAAAESEIARIQIEELADWTNTLHELTLRVEQAEQRVKTLTAERDHFKAMLRERADSLLEARAAAEKQSLEFRADARSIDAMEERVERATNAADADRRALIRAALADAFARGETDGRAAADRVWAEQVKSVRRALWLADCETSPPGDRALCHPAAPCLRCRFERLTRERDELREELNRARESCDECGS